MEFGKKDVVGIIVGIICIIAISISGWSIYRHLQKERERNAPMPEMTPEVMMQMMAHGGKLRGESGKAAANPGQGSSWRKQFKYTIELTQTIRKLTKLEGDNVISAKQAAKLLPILDELEKADKISQEEAKSKISSIKEILSESQLAAIEKIELPRRKRGKETKAASGSKFTPDMNPFKIENNKKTLTELTDLLKQKVKSTQTEKTKKQEKKTTTEK